MRLNFIGCEAQFLFGHGHHCSPSSSGGSKALSVTDNAWKPRGDGVRLHAARGGAMVKTAHIEPRIALAMARSLEPSALPAIPKRRMVDSGESAVQFERELRVADCH
jgi:hypothetical protein